VTAFGRTPYWTSLYRSSQFYGSGDLVTFHSTFIGRRTNSGVRYILRIEQNKVKRKRKAGRILLRTGILNGKNRPPHSLGFVPL